MRNVLRFSYGVVLFFVLTSSAVSQPGAWQTLQFSPSVLLQDIYFLADGQYGWAAGASSAAGQYLSLIARTTNGGTTWSSAPLSVNASITGVFFANQATGWAVGSGGTILFSSNGGLTWVPQLSPTGRLLAKVYFINATTGWAVGGWGNDGPAYLVLKTTNGGVNWIDQSFGGPGFSTESVFFLNDQTGWVGCRDNTLAPKIFKTTDGGTTWTSTALPTLASNVGFLSIKFGTERKGWAATTTINSNGPVLYTSDGGNTWVVQYSTNMHYHVLDVRDSNSVAVVGFRILGGQAENVSVTSNGGLSWNQYTPLLSNYTYGICYRGNNIWIASDNTQILVSSNNGINWSRQYQALRWKSIAWSSPTIGWITAGTSVGSDGYALKTMNGGTDWLPYAAAPGGSQVYFVDQNYGWMMFEGNNASVYRTSNGGQSWTQSYFNSGGTWIGRMFFANQSTGWGFGSTGKIMYTTNGGATWSSQTSGTTNYVEALFFVNPNEGWAGGGYGGGNGFILHTTNGGASWAPQTPASSDHVSDIFFLNTLEGWALCYTGTSQKTTNGGATWTPAGSVPQFFAQRLVMLNDAQTGWMCAYNEGTGGNDGRGFIYRTTNGGGTWTQQWSGSVINSDLFDLKPQGTTNLWAVGNHSTILKYGLPTGLGEDAETVTDYNLHQNYPNPFNPSTTIKYDLPKDSRVSLRLFNILGQEVVTLVKEEQKAGYKSVEWNANNFASGVYFYRLEAGTFTSVKKLLMLR